MIGTCPLYPQKQTSQKRESMSAKGQQQNSRVAALDLRFGHKRHELLDHLVRASYKHIWNIKPECFRRFEVNYHLIFGRLLYGQVSWLFTLEDTINITGCLPELIDKVGPVRN